jgi:hypothetical protein
MIQEFLNKNLITITDDVNVEKLSKASEDVVKKLNKAKPKIIPFALSALDPSVTVDNSEVTEVKDTILKHWTTFLSNVKDTPMTYIRSVMLQVLQALSDNDINNSAVIYLTGIDSLEYYNLGKQAALVKEFFEGLRTKIEADAAVRWTQQSVGSALPALDENGLATDSVDKVEIDKNLKAVKSNINKLIAESNLEIERRRVVQLRTHLLWWKEARYSPSLKMSYSQMDKKSVLPIVAAHDYSVSLPLVYPASADFFFKNTLDFIMQKENKATKIGDLIKGVRASDDVKTIVGAAPEEKEKVTLLNFVRGFVQGVYQIKSLSKLVGIDESKEILPSDFGLWILHNLQANKISSVK